MITLTVWVKVMTLILETAHPLAEVQSPGIIMCPPPSGLHYMVMERRSAKEQHLVRSAFWKSSNIHHPALRDKNQTLRLIRKMKG